MRVIVCGSRDWQDRVAIRSRLMAFAPMRVTIVHGNSRGADKIADHEARSLQLAVEPHSANWAEYGLSAGPIRNREMVDLGADLCIAFRLPGKSSGTDDMITKAKAAGIPVETIVP